MSTTTLYTNLPPASERAAKMRSQAYARMDKYCFFKWNNLDAWEEFHAFIIADKAGDLKFHTGPSFTNTYSSPQFGTNKNLLGVSYSTASISFKVGFYYITETEWRKTLEAFNPLEIAWLEFGYEPKWRYQCKVSKIADTSRYVLETIDDTDYYYAETTLTFDLVGDPVAYTQPYEFTCTEGKVAEEDGTNHSTNFFYIQTNTGDYTESDLDYPLDISVNLNLSRILNTENTENTNSNSFILTCKTGYGTDPVSNSTQLFQIIFQNISYSSVEENEKHWPAFLTIKYRSDTGVLLLLKGEQESLLSMQQSTATGNRLVQSMMSQPYKWGGKFYDITPSDAWERIPTIYFIIQDQKGEILDGTKIIYFDKNIYETSTSTETYGNEYAKIYISGCGLTRVV